MTDSKLPLAERLEKRCDPPAEGHFGNSEDTDALEAAALLRQTVEALEGVVPVLEAYLDTWGEVDDDRSGYQSLQEIQDALAAAYGSDKS